MQSMEWPPEHCDALREFLVGGLSYAATAKAINAKFDTGYSRSATIGRARRMGLAGSNRPQVLLRPRSNSNAPVRPKLHRKPFYKPWPDMPAFKRVEVKLRCVAVEPRHLSLFELGRGDCRYPYGGDAESEAITFCGHRQRPGFQLLRTAFSSDAEDRYARGTGRCRGCTPASASRTAK
jgi:GcrA cell cycle regulator